MLVWCESGASMVRVWCWYGALRLFHVWILMFTKVHYLHGFATIRHAIATNEASFLKLYAQ